MTTVAIGIPIYNEIKYIENTLKSILKNKYDQIIISDNASTDGSSEICKKYAKLNNKIIYIRSNENFPPNINFYKCLKLANTDYFSWVGAHDIIPHNYIQLLKNALDNTDAILAYPKNVVTHDKNYIPYDFFVYDYDDLLAHKKPEVRVITSIKKISNCTLYYGLYKTRILKSVINDTLRSSFFGIDHAELTRIAANGRMISIPMTVYSRIQYREKEDSQNRWRRVVSQIYQEDSSICRPEILPVGICYEQLNIAQQISNYTNNPEKYMLQAGIILLRRWGVNSFLEKAVSIILAQRIPRLFGKILGNYLDEEVREIWIWLHQAKLFSKQRLEWVSSQLNSFSETILTQ